MGPALRGRCVEPPVGDGVLDVPHRRMRHPRRSASHASRPRRRGGRLCPPVLPAPLALFRRGRRPRRPVSAAAPRCHCEERSDAAIRLSFRKDGFPRQCVPQGHLLRGAHWLGMTERGRRDTWVPPYGYARYTTRRTRRPRRPAYFSPIIPHRISAALTISSPQ